MTRADSLAGLAEVIAGHDGYWTMYPVESGRLHWKVTCSGCESVIGEGRTPSPGLIAFADIHRAHVAAVALAWLEGHGWTEGVEEWGLQYERQADPTMDNPSGVVTNTMVSTRGEAHVRRCMENGVPSSGRNLRIVRRRVTAWAPVETGENA